MTFLNVLLHHISRCHLDVIRPSPLKFYDTLFSYILSFKTISSILTRFWWSFFCKTMIYFTKWFLSRNKHLVLLSDKNQPRDVLVEKPLGGFFTDYWPSLDNSSILLTLSVETPLSQKKSVWVLQSSIHGEASKFKRVLTLKHRIIEGQTRWSAVTKVPGEFYFTNYCWE